MAETKTGLLINNDDDAARGPPPRSIDYKIYNASLFFLPTIGLLVFEAKNSAAHGLPLASLEKANFLFPIYTGLVILSLVTVAFTWIFRTSGCDTSANILIGTNIVLICVMAPMLVWELVTLQAYNFFGVLAVVLFIVLACFVFGGEKKK